MTDRFLPPDYQQLFRQYQDCRQGTWTVNEYMEEFVRLTNRNDQEEIEDQQISRFVHGLRVSIGDQVSLQTLYTLNETVNLSKKIEYQHLRASSKFPTIVQSLLVPRPTTINSPCLHHDQNSWLRRIVVSTSPQQQQQVSQPSKQRTPTPMLG